MRRRKNYFTVNPGDPQPIEQRVKRRIAFSEVDAMAVAWHGNYPRFFEAAHSELMQKIGLGFAVYAANSLNPKNGWNPGTVFFFNGKGRPYKSFLSLVNVTLSAILHAIYLIISNVASSPFMVISWNTFQSSRRS